MKPTSCRCLPPEQASIFNNALLGAGLIPDQPASIDVRVVANINNTLDDVVSEVVTLTVTPYSDVISADPIYLLGSGSPVGWDNQAALEMVYVGDGKFEIVTTLTAGQDQFIKFIANLGQWAPQWGTDGSGTSDSGPLVYRPTESEPDPAAIPVPDVTSQYKIIADTVNLTYQIFEFGEVYMLGDGTSVGWDNQAAVPMIKVDEGQYTITTDLVGGGFIKFIDERGQWAPQWGTDHSGTSDSGPLVYRPTESEPDPAAIPGPPGAGSYKIDIDINALTYTITPQ